MDIGRRESNPGACSHPRTFLKINIEENKEI
jgi:hypothetical protein